MFFCCSSCVRCETIGKSLLAIVWIVLTLVLIVWNESNIHPCLLICRTGWLTRLDVCGKAGIRDDLLNELSSMGTQKCARRFRCVPKNSLPEVALSQSTPNDYPEKEMMMQQISIDRTLEIIWRISLATRNNLRIIWQRKRARTFTSTTRWHTVQRRYIISVRRNLKTHSEIIIDETVKTKARRRHYVAPTTKAS